MRLYLLVLVALMAVGGAVLSMPVEGHPEVPTTAAPATSSSRPKREDSSDGLCCGAHAAKREASCCGGESPKPCCGQGADEACCGSQKQANMEGKAKREAAGGSNDTCCGKERVARAATTTTAKPEVTTAPVVAPARFAREENKSCCGVEEAKVEKPKREAGDKCCGESAPNSAAEPVVRVGRDTSNSSCCGETSPNKGAARVTRDVCCGLKDDDAKKCCGAEASAPGKNKRCIQTTTTGPH